MTNEQRLKLIKGVVNTIDINHNRLDIKNCKIITKHMVKCDIARTFGPHLSYFFHGVLHYLARLRRHSPWWIVGPVEQRFTGYEFDKAMRKWVGFGTSAAFEGVIRLGRGRMHSLHQKKEALERPLYDLGSGEVFLQFVLSSVRGGRSTFSYFTRRRHQPRPSSAPRAKRQVRSGSVG